MTKRVGVGNERGRSRRRRRGKRKEGGKERGKEQDGGRQTRGEGRQTHTCPLGLAEWDSSEPIKGAEWGQ